MGYMRDDARRRRFLAYFRTTLSGDRGRLIAKTGYTKGRVSQLFDDAQPFGERAASSLAGRLGLPADYFERDTSSSLSTEALELAAQYDAMNHGERSRLQLLLQAARDSVHSPRPTPPPAAEPASPQARKPASPHKRPAHQEDQLTQWDEWVQQHAKAPPKRHAKDPDH